MIVKYYNNRIAYNVKQQKSYMQNYIDSILTV